MVAVSIFVFQSIAAQALASWRIASSSDLKRDGLAAYFLDTALTGLFGIPGMVLTSPQRQLNPLMHHRKLPLNLERNCSLGDST